MTIRVTPADDLQAAMDSASAGDTVHLAPGIYRQKVMITTRDLRIMGSGAAETVIVWDDHAKKPHPIGWEYNTFRTYTVAVCADGIRMEHLTVANDALAPEIKGQQVALSVVADDFSMENCVLTATQDTLFCGPLPSDLIGRYEGFLLDPLRRGGEMKQRFRSCRIEGTVDFIFGCGCAVFENCEIRSLRDARNIGYIAAPAHSLLQKEGFLFRNCRLTCEEGVAEGSVYLARPWRDYGMVRFENCGCGRHIAPAGFDQWSGTNRDRTARFFEIPPISGRVTWVNRF